TRITIAVTVTGITIAVTVTGITVAVTVAGIAIAIARITIPRITIARIPISGFGSRLRRGGSSIVTAGNSKNQGRGQDQVASHEPELYPTGAAKLDLSQSDRPRSRAVPRSKSSSSACNHGEAATTL